MKKNKIAVLSLSILLLGANTVMASDVKIKNVDNFKAPAYEAMVKEYKSIQEIYYLTHLDMQILSLK